MITALGLYKIKFKGGYHFLRLSIQGGKKVFKIDHGNFEPIERLHHTEDAIEVICQVNEKNISPKDVRYPKMTLSWEDSEHRRFTMTFCDLWVLRNILQEFPFLQGPLNYTKRKK